MLQFLFFLGYAWVAALVGARAYEWISAGSGFASIYLRAVLFGGAGFVVLCTLPILAKWVLIGRWKPQQIRIWSLAYVRFWIVKTLVRSNPLAFLIVGSPLYVLYLRALGAKVGRRRRDLLPACARVHRPAHHRRRHGHPQGRVLPVLPGAGGLDPDRPGHRRPGRCSSARRAVLDIGTSMGDGAQLGHASALYGGQAVPDGERWHGCPAQRTEVNYLRVAPARCGTLRRVRFCAVTLLCVFFLYLPLVEGGVFLLLTAVPSLGKVLNPGTDAITSRALYIDARPSPSCSSSVPCSSACCGCSPSPGC